MDREFYAIITDLAGTPVEVVTPAEATTAGIAVVGLWGSATWNGDAATLLRFPGQQYDSETGLHYNLNRFYDPGTGRYLTQDPLGLAPASNPGIYPHNPTTWIDPLGLIPERCNVEVGGGASLDNITPGEAQRIQNAADKIGHPITLVGSRGEGTAHAFSDWDYIVEDFNNQIRKKIYNSLPIGSAELGYGRRFDILRGPVDTSRPYITFNPR